MSTKTAKERKTVFITPDGVEHESLKIRTEYDSLDEDPSIEIDATTAWLRSSPTIGKEAWRRALGIDGHRHEFDRGDIGQLLQEAGTFIRETQYRAVAESARYTRRDAEEFLGSALTAVGEIKGVMGKILEAEKELYEAWDETEKRIADRRRKFRESVKSLGDNIEIPYGISKLVEIAERFDHLSPGAWAKVIELAGVLRGDRG